MFSVLFEVRPKSAQWDAYLGYAKLLRPELEQIDGFVDNIRFRSLRREGWLLSLSTWRDEKALVRWRTQAMHHAVQEKGRSGVFEDYHLRVGEVTQDTAPPVGHILHEQRLDETETGSATAVMLIDLRLPDGRNHSPDALALAMGLDPNFPGLVEWDVFDAVLSPGDAILMACWRKPDDARSFESMASFPDGARLRHVRVIRDYGMFDRREAPQFYPDVT